jgi:hypothetical protein
MESRLWLQRDSNPILSCDHAFARDLHGLIGGVSSPAACLRRMVNSRRLDVPLVLLEDDGMFGLADADGVTLETSGQAVQDGQSEATVRSIARHLLFLRWSGQTAAWRPSVERQASRMRRTPVSRLSKSAVFCSKSARTCAHGADPARRRVTISWISASVSPRRRACATNASRPSTSAG